MAQAAELRTQIRYATDERHDAALRTLWGATEDALTLVRLYGDLTLAAFFSNDRPKTREAQRLDYAKEVKEGRALQYCTELERLREAERPLLPFHWEVEFPEVFQRERPGFDALVGNPPFLGGSKISSNFGDSYLDWLQLLHPEAHGNADIVAHFFRRAFTLLRPAGSMGLIATNTIAQGDTRATGLSWICSHGGTIYQAERRLPWPGQAAVIVSVIQIMKGDYHGVKLLDGRAVTQITAFLFHSGGHENPARLNSNAQHSFLGAKIYGQGFTFDDTDPQATPIVEMERLIAANPRNAELIFPYIGGEELNSSPTHAYHRYVINFGTHSEAECRQTWPELLAIVEAKVKPERMKLRDTADGQKLKVAWWQFSRTRPELQSAIAPLSRVLAISQVTSHLAFAFLPTNMVYSNTLNIFPFDTYAAFCALQSRLHELWVRFFGSSMKDDLRYTPSDCFENFPFPRGWEAHPGLEAAGRAYYEQRAALMQRNNEGLTKIYNRFHDPYESDPAIETLRELHGAMDRTLLDAYGWSDIATDYAFLLDYAIDEEEWGSKKKPYRYRWPDRVRDELLGRLLALNAQRTREEQLAGAAPGRSRKQRPPQESGMQNMFE